jgi:hypothetical protein
MTIELQLPGCKESFSVSAVPRKGETVQIGTNDYEVLDVIHVILKKKIIVPLIIKRNP